MWSEIDLLKLLWEQSKDYIKKVNKIKYESPAGIKHVTTCGKQKSTHGLQNKEHTHDSSAVTNQEKGFRSVSTLLLFSLIWIKKQIRQCLSIPLTQQGTQSN